MVKMFLATNGRHSSIFLRVLMAAVMFPHGAQKALGAFGGHGFEATMKSFTEDQGLPWIVAFLVIVAEFLGAIGLFFGFLTRLCALGIGCVMVGAIVKVHAANGLFMNWFGNQAGEGYEYHLLAIAICIALFLDGGGRFSADRALSQSSGRGR